MANHPIENLMDTVMNNFKTMVDVNTVVGTPVTGLDGTIIIPVSTVSYGFGVGGTEFESKKNLTPDNQPMFGGGYGGGANVKPIAFLVVSGDNIKILPVTPEGSPVNKIIDMVPDLMDKVNGIVSNVASKFGHKEKSNKDSKKTEKSDFTVEIVD